MLERFPLLPFGKIDLRALPPLEMEHDQVAAESGTPRKPFEQTIALVFSEVLGKKKVGADQNFFDLGGNSLSAAQAITRIREELQVELSITDLFESPTVREIAARIVHRKEENQTEFGERVSEENLRRALDLLENF
jgi:acyl carrier protein